MLFRIISILLVCCLAFTQGCVQDDEFLALQYNYSKLEERVQKMESGSLRKAQDQLSTLEQSQRTHGGTLDQSLNRLSNLERGLDTLQREHKTLLSRIDRLEKSQLSDKQALKSDLETFKKDSVKSTQSAMNQLRLDFNEAQKELSKSLDTKMSKYSKDIETRVNQLSSEITNFYKELEKTIQSYSKGTYIVKPGESLSKIAQDLGISVDELSRINNIKDPGKIYVGQELILP